MTKWKLKSETLIMMHAHNRWSRLYDYVMTAAADLNVPVCAREYANHYDGSRDREWIVPAGTKRAIYDLAYARQSADLGGGGGMTIPPTDDPSKAGSDMNERDTTLLAWEKLNDTLRDLYRQCAREREQGYDRETTRNAVYAAERAEHEAWLNYRSMDCDTALLVQEKL